MYRLIYCLISLFAIGSSVAGACETVCQEQRTVSVSGRAELEVPPDFMVIRTGVSLQGDDPSALQRELRESTSKILTFTKGIGISEKDVRTDHISIEETYWDYEEVPQPEGFPKFEGSSVLRIELTDFALYDELIQGLFENGANSLGIVRFDTSRRIELTREIRLEAVRAAKRKATEIAEALGQRLGVPLTVSEGNVSSYGSSSSNAFVVTGINTSAGLSSASIGTNTIEISASISVVFSLESPNQ